MPITLITVGAESTVRQAVPYNDVISGKMAVGNSGPDYYYSQSGALDHSDDTPALLCHKDKP